jgi:phosphatidylglycerophosphatase A
MLKPSKDTSRNKDGGHLPFVTRLIATGLFSGYAPWGSGTAGTLMGVALYLIPGAETTWVLLLLVVTGFAAGVVTSARVADAVGNQLTPSAERAKAAFQAGALHTADPSIVVIDEIVGFWVTMLFVPKTPAAILIGFVAFRAMDILKPQPARYLERYPHGWGIMLDDVVAGIYANLLTQIVLRLSGGI